MGLFTRRIPDGEFSNIWGSLGALAEFAMSRGISPEKLKSYGPRKADGHLDIEKIGARWYQWIEANDRARKRQEMRDF